MSARQSLTSRNRRVSIQSSILERTMTTQIALRHPEEGEARKIEPVRNIVPSGPRYCGSVRKIALFHTSSHTILPQIFPFSIT